MGVAMKIEDKVPIITPNINANTKPLITSPPKMKIANRVTNVVPEVLIVRAKVALTALLIVSFISRLG